MMIEGVDIRVVELLCSRICHDLVSPVGAINNGVELIRETTDEAALGEMGGEALGLISHSADQAARRLMVMRFAYGAAGSDATIGLGDVRGAVTQLFAGTKVTLTWTGDVPDERQRAARGFAKVLVNTILLASEAIGQQGEITIGAGPNGETVITATGRNAALKADISAALAGTLPPEMLGPRTIHAFMTGRFADHFGLVLRPGLDTPGALRLHLDTGPGARRSAE